MSFINRLAQWLRERPRLADALAGVAALVNLLGLIHYADVQYSVLDEGLYLYKGLLFASGQYIPFQDYGLWTNQMPASYLIPGWVQMIFGAGLRTGRVFAILLAIGMLIALWLISRRLGGSWIAAGITWAVALNPATTRMYSTATSQGLIACLLMWTLFFTLGADRKRWQVFAGGLLAGLIVVTRVNMLPLLPLIALYIWWERGWKDALLIAGAMLITFGGVHAWYWPGILKIWARWLPTDLFPFLKAWLPPQAVPSWRPDDPLSFKVDSFFLALRYHFVALIGALCAWLLWPRRAAWKSESHFRMAVFLSALLIVLGALHAWASLGNSYCTFCFPTYTAFYSGLGLLLFAITIPVWERNLSTPRQIVVSLALMLALAGMAHSAVGAINDLLPKHFLKNLLAFGVPRFRGGQILSGRAELWSIFANRFGLSYETIYDAAFTLVPVLLALITGLAILMIGSWLTHRLRQNKITQGGRGLITLALFLALGFALAPTILLGDQYNSYDCGPGQLAAYEQSGAQLAQIIPPGAQIYWAGYSPTTLLYLPQARVYPAQLHLTYSFRDGDSDALLRYGWWNDQLARRWLNEADFILIRQSTYRHSDSVPPVVEAGAYSELTPTVNVELCRDESYLRVFRRNP